MKTLIEFAEEQVKDVKYIFEDTLTICIITTTNNFKVTGESFACDASRYDQIIGMEVARKKAFDKLVEICSFNFKKA